MTRVPHGVVDWDARYRAPGTAVGPIGKQHSGFAADAIVHCALPLLAWVLMFALGARSLAQTQQMNTVTSEAYLPSNVTSDGLGNVYFPYSGYIYYLPPGTANVTYAPVAGSGGLYPFTQPIVGLNSDVAGDLFVAIQNPINSPTNGPYVQVFELLKGSAGWTWGGQVYGQTLLLHSPAAPFRRSTPWRTTT